MAKVLYERQSSGNLPVIAPCVGVDDSLMQTNSGSLVQPEARWDNRWMAVDGKTVKDFGMPGFIALHAIW